jgi:hypothetical protein
MLLAQFLDGQNQRGVAVTDEAGRTRRLNAVASTRDLALQAIVAGRSLKVEIEKLGTSEGVDLEQLYADGRLLSPLDHPDPAHCFVGGTGLTHLGSAEGRDKMHKNLADAATLTDSMKMFKMGLEGGKPAAGQIGVQPEWFYKGDGSSVARPGSPLPSPSFALDGGEEPEVTGLYVIGPDGTPFCLGFALGNEFSDHVTEKQNYLFLAHSKLRPSSFGPQLRVGPLMPSVEGTSRILRDGRAIWQKPFLSGEANMSHTLANLEHHHFKYAQFRRPGDVHVHYFGTATLSFSEGFKTQAGDVFEIEAPGFGLPLRNTIGSAAADGVYAARML